LAGCNRRQRTAVSRFEHEGDDIRGFLDTAHDAVRPRRLSGVNVSLLVHPRLLRDELEREQPIDLIPSGGDLQCHSVAENLTD
jgi:hypothetical protein